MSKIVQVRNVKIGAGAPKIAVSLMGTDDIELETEISKLNDIKFDVAEWRVDFFKDVEEIESVKKTLLHIRKWLNDIPIIFTFRSKNEGGNKEISREYYINLLLEVIETKEADLIDVELFTGDDEVKKIINTAHKKGVKVIISNHDFEKTPSKEKIIKRIKKMIDLGADIPKIALMPKCREDVLTLLSATSYVDERYSGIPIITMSMGSMGMVSRIAGELFGSSLTFGAAEKSSAPGQIQANDLSTILQIIHKSKK
ncbi:MAG TPA: type I 3-dehydroquinate dehydratase [Clostridium sp.]|nr:type I 3-dehydroquinate dehydratase [Clostridium sp.]